MNSIYKSMYVKLSNVHKIVYWYDLWNSKVHGQSLLHIAAEKGYTDIFEILSDPTYEIDTTLRDKVLII